MITKENRDRHVFKRLPRDSAQSLLDSLNESLAVLDDKGVIVSVNRTWTEFPSVNGGIALDRGEVGENYLRLFRDTFVGTKRHAAPGMVLTGEKEKFSFEYSCNPPGGKAWFRLSMTPIIRGGEVSGAVVSHTDVTRQKRAEHESKKLAVIDPLTGILNRKAGLESLRGLIKISERQKRKLTVCYIDLDNLKFVNDNFGHNEGDKAIRKAVKLIRKVLRESDVMCRLGGDEILLVLPNTGLDQGARVIDRITERMSGYNEKHRSPWKLGISYGLAEYPAAGRCSADALIDRADRSMYRMKTGKKQNTGVTHPHETSKGRG